MKINLWHLIHEYLDLNEDGKVPDLICPNGGHKMWPIIDPDGDDPAFYCGACEITVYPGIHVWDQIGAAVRDANNE